MLREYRACLPRGNLKFINTFFYKEKLRTYDVDNYRILGKSVEIFS